MYRTNSKYYEILKARSADLDFLMPQFYNGVTRPVADGVDGSSGNQGATNAAAIFSLLSNDMFQGKPEKVVFGFCISDCGGTGSNANAAQAAQIMSELKTVDGGANYCNGGAFFWVVEHDTNGAWSDTVSTEVRLTSGCSSSQVTTSSTSSSSVQTTSTSTSASTTTSSSSTTTTTTTSAGACGIKGDFCTDNRECCNNRCDRRNNVCKS